MATIGELKSWREAGIFDKERYHRYLCSREWGLLRQAVRERCGGWCERCKAAPMSHVHHVTYIRKYNERPDDLRGYCEPCHEYTHGLRDEDPMLRLPVKLFGLKVESVYLAGRISNGNGSWRSEIIPGWDVDGNHAKGGDAEGPFAFDIPDGRPVAYSGPFWTDIYAGHGGGLGPHAAAGWDGIGEHHGFVESASVESTPLALSIRNWIAASDLVFAWLDSRDAFGTLVEIGYASGVCKTIVVAAPDMDRELWLAAAFAHRFIRARSAGEAWAKLWRGPDPLDGVGEVVDRYEC